MSLEQIFTDIKASFNGLWQTKHRGNSIEIITPYATTNNRFVSVFITQQGSDYVLTDGGWLNSGIYDIFFQNEETSFLKILYHYQSSFDIKETTSNEGTTFYYLKVANPIDIPSKIFDLATFIQSIVSVSEISFESKAEKETKARFISKANEYLKSFLHYDKIKTNVFLQPENKELKFNAIYFSSPKELNLINYITGSSYNYFINSISKSNMLFEMADITKYQSYIKSKISLIDTTASGYIPEKFAHYLIHLEKHTGSKVINWSEKEKLQSILN
jgi:hypothetical protein